MASNTVRVAVSEPSYPERRKRHVAMIPAIITLDDGEQIQCVIRDLSYGGAKIGVTRHHRLPHYFNLTIPSRSLTFRVEYVWQRGDFAGVKIPMTD
jgi:hypothetical protein